MDWSAKITRKRKCAYRLCFNQSTVRARGKNSLGVEESLQLIPLMDTAACNLRTLNILHFRTRPSLLRPLCFFQLGRSLHFSLSSSSPPRFSPLSENGNGSSVPHGAGEAVSNVSHKKLLQVVLVSPQIPGNTGCIARSCAATAVGLHLIEPLGFQVDDTKLKRAGLDYWPFVIVKIHGSWTEFRDYFSKQEGEKRLLAFTKRGTNIHSEFSYRSGDYLVFGSETSGLPPEALQDCKSETLGGGTIRIPMVETYVRCLNLSVSVGIALYEASRQLNYEQLQIPPESCVESEQSIMVEDIFA